MNPQSRQDRKIKLQNFRGQSKAQNSSKEDTPHSRDEPQFPTILALAIVALFVIGYLKGHNSPVKSVQPLPKPTIDYVALIQVNTNQANQKTEMHWNFLN